MLRSLGRPGIKHTMSSPSLRAVCLNTPPACATGSFVPAPSGQSRSLVSSVLLTAEGYESRQVTELRALLRQRGLATSGRKAELVQRLKQNDMVRAGSTLASSTQSTEKTRRSTRMPRTAAAPAHSLSMMPISARTKTTARGKKGSDAANAAEKTMPSMSIEPGTIVSGTTVLNSDGATVSSPKKADSGHATVPGNPESSSARGSEPVFNVTIPFEEPMQPEPQYIPSIHMLENPAAYNSKDSFHSDWHIPHVPRVHNVGQTAEVSHNASISISEQEGAPVASGGILTDLMSDYLPNKVQRQVQQSVASTQQVTRNFFSDLVTDVSRSMPMDPSMMPSKSTARPSTRRALNDGERKGLWVLGGIVASGFFLGGLHSNDKKQAKVPSATANASDAPGYQAPSFQKGGGIVGACERKV